MVDEGMDNGMADLGISMTQSGGGGGFLFPPEDVMGMKKLTFS